jgi:hypothetical protein
MRVKFPKEALTCVSRCEIRDCPNDGCVVVVHPDDNLSPVVHSYVCVEHWVRGEYPSESEQIKTRFPEGAEL